MKTPAPPLLAALSLVALIALPALGASPEAAGPEPDASGRVQGPAFVDSTDILYLESYPVQVRLAVTGSLPTPCHEPVWAVAATGDAIAVTLWSEADADAVCASVLAPFEISIPLGAFERADLPVTLNGEDVGSVSVGQPGPAPSGTTWLSGAGWSFGMCLGYCHADLVVDADDLVLVGRDREQATPLFENRGSLTAEGRAALDAALAALGDTPLEPVYGCPDCADGGASYLTLVRDGLASRHDMEHGAPPPELTELDALATTFIDALQACRSGALVTVDDSCVAWQG
jgi:hypothetical protein